MAAIRFLTTVARSVHSKLFADTSVLKQICESIVLPNLRVSDAWQPGRPAGNAGCIMQAAAYTPREPSQQQYSCSSTLAAAYDDRENIDRTWQPCG
jgi:hypothetical protein